jgi:signal transduction histidine kinase
VKVNRLYAHIVTDTPTPFVKQLPLTVFFLLALLTIFIAPDIFLSNSGAVIVGMGLALIATVLAVYFTYRSVMSGPALLVPAIDFFAIGFLRAGTGTNNSAFAVLVALPLVWFAMEYGRRYVIYASLGGFVTLSLYSIFEWQLLADPSFLLRALVTPTVFGAVAFVINVMSRSWKHRSDAFHRQATERAQLLDESIERADKLAKSEAKLREMERMFRGLWSAVTEQSVIGTDRTGLIDVWNPGATKMLGLTDSETEGIRRIDEFHLAHELQSRSKELDFPPGETVLNSGFSALVEPARLGNADVREWTYVGADGRHIPVDLAVTARLGESGEITGYLFIANDMTKVKELSRLKDEFLGLISHELRTPLSSIIGYLELLREEEGTELSENQLRYIAVADRNAQRLLRLVGDLLFAAQADSGVFQMDMSVQSLDGIVAASVESAQPAATSAGITLVTDIENSITIDGDAVRLGQVFDNLISNAIKFTPPGGEVSVTVSAEPTHAVVAVRDTGMGIAADELDRLFSRFFRGSTATRNAIPGVGLGLVITKAIVTAHGGELGVSSEVGKGTCFTVTLPRGGS